MRSLVDLGLEILFGAAVGWALIVAATMLDAYLL
jgi:hypothetical protein